MLVTNQIFKCLSGKSGFQNEKSIAALNLSNDFPGHLKNEKILCLHKYNLAIYSQNSKTTEMWNVTAQNTRRVSLSIAQDGQRQDCRNAPSNFSVCYSSIEPLVTMSAHSRHFLVGPAYA